MIGNLLSLTSSLDRTTEGLNASYRRLSSGSRINSAKDDAAGLVIASALQVQLGSNAQAQQNINDGLSITDTASGAIGQVSDALQRMRELAVQAANGTNSPSDRQAIQAEFTQLSQSIDQTSSQAQFNGQNLLDGSFNTQIQSGPNAGDTQPLSIGNLSTSGLGISGLDVSTAQGASNALGSIDQALASVTAQQTSIGAAQAGLNSTASVLSGTYENVAAAASRIADTDYASESTNLAQNQVQQQAAIKAIALYNANQSSVLGLLPNSTQA